MDKLFEVNFWQTVVEQSIQWLIRSGPTILIIILIGLVALKLVSTPLKRFQKLLAERAREKGGTPEEAEKRLNTIMSIIRTVARVVIWTIVVMMLLRELGVDIAPIIAGVGVIGLAVGFGAQNLVRDVISGFFLLLENQVREGDVAIINGTGGLVERITLRTIQLRDLSGTVHVFPNGAVNSLSNMTKGWSAMVFEVGVAYKEDTDQVVEVMKTVAADLQSDPEFTERILEPMEVFGVDQFADSAVIIKGRIKTSPIQQWAVGREYRRRLKKAFDEAGIEIPFPHRSVYFGEASKPFSVQKQVSSLD